MQILGDPTIMGGCIWPPGCSMTAAAEHDVTGSLTDETRFDVSFRQRENVGLQSACVPPAGNVACKTSIWMVPRLTFPPKSTADDF